MSSMARVAPRSYTSLRKLNFTEREMITVAIAAARPSRPSILRRLAAHVLAAIAARRTVSALSRLSDHALRDIGLERHQIAEISSRTYGSDLSQRDLTTRLAARISAAGLSSRRRDARMTKIRAAP